MRCLYITLIFLVACSSAIQPDDKEAREMAWAEMGRLAELHNDVEYGFFNSLQTNSLEEKHCKAFADRKDVGASTFN